MSTEHTPGPWEAEIVISDRGGWDTPTQTITISAGEDIIAHYDTRAVEYPYDEENDANARLIASAPDLLRQRDELRTMCKRLLAAFSSPQYARNVTDKALVADARAILDK